LFFFRQDLKALELTPIYNFIGKAVARCLNSNLCNKYFEKNFFVFFN